MKRLKSGFELDYMYIYKEYDDLVSVNDINESKSYFWIILKYLLVYVI